MIHVHVARLIAFVGNALTKTCTRLYLATSVKRRQEHATYRAVPLKEVAHAARPINHLCCVSNSFQLWLVHVIEQ